MACLLTRYALFAAGLLPVWGAFAQIADPTRPPSGLSVATGSGGEEGMPSAKVLQSIFVPEKGTPVAMIGGQFVRLGEKFGDSRLVRLTEHEAVLQGPEGVERLLLTPEAEKVVAEQAQENKLNAAKTGKRGGKR